MLITVTIGLSSCFKDMKVIYADMQVEFQETVVRAPTAGKLYPLISVNNGVGVQTTRVNLVGPQRPTATEIKVSLDASNTTALDGTHFKLGNNGTVTIPANSSFGDLSIEILKAPAQAGKTVNLVLKLDGNSTDIKPSENYRYLGYAIKL